MEKLNSNIDLNIKRYLRSISDKHTISRVNGSCHYKLKDCNLDIRFANHHKSVDISILNIVKCTQDIYMISFGGITYNLYAHDVLPYIKALLLVGPEFVDTTSTLLKELNTSLRQNNDLNVKLLKVKEDSEIIDSIWDDNNQLKSQIRELQNKINNLKTKIKSLEKYKSDILSKKVGFLCKLDDLKKRINSI